ncbi:hypothetical protein [Thermoflexibacter ruber]|nr:hypothetical protein [Thermoflexibacter ruber]
MISINVVRRAREVLFNPALRKHLSVGSNAKNPHDTTASVYNLRTLLTD